MEYLTNSSNLKLLFDFNKNKNKEYESYEKFLKFYYQNPTKKDPYLKDFQDGNYILIDSKNHDKKIIIQPAKYINLNNLFKNLKIYNEIILEKISILIEKPNNFNDDDRNYFNELKKNYSLYSKKIQEIDLINKNYFDMMDKLTEDILDNSLLMAKYYNERNLFFNKISNPILIESKKEIITVFSKNNKTIPSQNDINKLGKKLSIFSDEIENWFNWNEKCYQYLLVKNILYNKIKEQNDIKKEFSYKCENFIIKKPLIIN